MTKSFDLNESGTDTLAVLDVHLRSKLQSLAAEPVDSQRLFHGRGHCYSGLEMLAIDLYDPVVCVTLFVAGEHEAAILRSIERCYECFTSRFEALVVQRRYLDGSPMEVLRGAQPETVYARRGDLRFHLKLGQRQNSGYFLDMEPGRVWLEGICRDKKVLNLFSYTCAFSVVAVQAGAAEVINVDMSRAALNLGRDNHHLNNLPKQNSRFLSRNILKSWNRIKQPGPYDIAIIDPPTFQRGSFICSKDYARVIRRLPEFMRAGGDILACLNAPMLNVDFLRQLFAVECPQCEFVGRLEPSADFPDVDADRQLKLLHFRFRRAEESAPEKGFEADCSAEGMRLSE
jgi:23S rRNA (cytosine1962-C5)-methyltransferase